MRRAAEIYLGVFMVGGVVFVAGFTLAGATPSRAVLFLFLVSLLLVVATVAYLGRPKSR